MMIVVMWQAGADLPGLGSNLEGVLMALTLGIDLGTSGVRAVAVDETGAIVAESTRTYRC